MKESEISSRMKQMSVYELYQATNNKDKVLLDSLVKSKMVPEINEIKIKPSKMSEVQINMKDIHSIAK